MFCAIVFDGAVDEASAETPLSEQVQRGELLGGSDD